MNKDNKTLVTKDGPNAKLYRMVQGLLHRAGLDYMHVSVFIKDNVYPNALSTATNNKKASIIFTTGLLKDSNFSCIKACTSHEVGHLLIFQQDKTVLPILEGLYNHMANETKDTNNLNHINDSHNSSWELSNYIKPLIMCMDFVSYIILYDLKFFVICNYIFYFGIIFSIIVALLIFYNNIFMWLYNWYSRRLESKADIIGSSLTTPIAVSNALIHIKQEMNKLDKSFGYESTSKLTILLGMSPYPTVRTRTRKIFKANKKLIKNKKLK